MKQASCAQIFAKQYLHFSNLNFTMKGASFNIAILSFFSRHGQYFHPTKDQPRTRPPSPFLYICCNFGQIFCTNVIQFFSVENMGHNQLRKCSKYHLVSLLNEKQRSTFANFLHLFYPCPLLTNSALALSGKKIILKYNQMGTRTRERRFEET